MSKFETARISELVKARVEEAIVLWAERVAVPLAQEVFNPAHTDTGRYEKSIRSVPLEPDSGTVGVAILMGGTVETPSYNDDGRGDILVDYAVELEARFSPARKIIVPALADRLARDIG